MIYSMFRYANPELRYHCFSRTVPYHATIPLVNWDSLVMPMTKRRRPGGVRTHWSHLKQKRRLGGGNKRGWESLFAHIQIQYLFYGIENKLKYAYLHWIHFAVCNHEISDSVLESE